MRDMEVTWTSDDGRLDTATLLAWLRDRANAKNPIVGAIYAGLVTRIERGEFAEGDQ